MHPFESAEGFGFLIGRELSFVTLAPFALRLTFLESGFINVEFGIEYVDGDGRVHRHDPQRGLAPDAIALHALIGERIATVEAAKWRLSLVFESGRSVHILSDDSDEAGQIHWQGKLIVF